MSIFKRVTPLSVLLSAIFLLLLVAGGAQMYAQQAENIKVGEVTNVNVGFAGDTAETADVVVAADDGRVTASVETRNVPEAGQTVAVFENDGQWSVPKGAAWKAGLRYPYTVGWPVLLGGSSALAGMALLYASSRRSRESDSAEYELAQPAEEPAATTAS